MQLNYSAGVLILQLFIYIVMYKEDDINIYFFFVHSLSRLNKNEKIKENQLFIFFQTKSQKNGLYSLIYYFSIFKLKSIVKQ